MNGQDIAVKRLSTSSRQGNVEFRNELMLLARLHHKNLVRLLGFCLEGVERLLVYEFVENSSLDRFIFGSVFAFGCTQRQTLCNFGLISNHLNSDNDI